MRFDCGHDADTGRLFNGQVLCLGCTPQKATIPLSRGVPLPERNEDVNPPVLAQATDLKMAIDLLKKRLPSEWSSAKLERLAQRMTRAQT